MTNTLRNLIKKATTTGNSENIVHYIEYLYQFEKFKNIFNLTLSLIKQNRLSFEISATTYAMEEGLCKTIRSSGMNRYVIVLKKLNPYIIIHELAHMVENELNFPLEQDFIYKVYQDIEQNFTRSNLLVQRLINQVIFKQIQAYDNVKSRASELFARFFELFAWAKEVYPKDTEYLIHTQDLDKIFSYTNQWKKSYLDSLIMSILDHEIKEYSNKTPMKDISTVRTKWANKIPTKNKKGSSIFGA